MADNEQIVVLENTNFIENPEAITVTQGDTAHDGVISDDILQQAFEEASDGLNSSTVQYTADNVLTVADGSIITDSSTSGNILTAVAPDGTTYRIVTSDDNTHCSAEGDQHLVTSEGHILTCDDTQIITSGVAEDSHVVAVAPDSMIVEEQLEQPQAFFATTVSDDNVIDVQKGGSMQVIDVHEEESTNIMQSENEQVITLSDTVVMEHQHVENGHEIVIASETPQTDEGSEMNTEPANVTVVSGIKQTNPSAPLGSSQNPIRIVQQGNQYTSLQQLTPEQLTQIMQVVQEQQVAKSAKSSDAGSTVLFNPQTQTRIVYKVLYPSQMHGTGEDKSRNRGITIQVDTDSVTIPSQKRPYRKRKQMEEEDDKIDAPELTKEEKEEKKKVKPRTRSGRVSRPPKHMIQDYKHIHLVDWDEEYDDSDGGYSDYKVSDEDEEEDDENVYYDNEEEQAFERKRKRRQEESDFTYFEGRLHGNGILENTRVPAQPSGPLEI